MTAAARPAGDREIPAPRSPRREAGRGSSMERHGWLFLRGSGLVLMVLVLGQVLTVAVLDGGVYGLNFAVMAGRWASPGWRIWDLALLWLAELHGAVGLRTVINDYARRAGTRRALLGLLAVAVILTVGLGTVVIATFDAALG